MSSTPPAVKQQPPSPPQSNDGDFDLSAVQQHVAALDDQVVPSDIKSTAFADHTDQYGDPSQYQTAGNHMYYPSQQGFHRSAQPATPPTTGYDNVMRTRSGRSLGTPSTGTDLGTSRGSRSPKQRAKRPPRNATTSRKTIELAEPLSVLTKDWAVPLGDIAAKVNRSAEQRQGEVNNRKNSGKVPRPMNSFMLYRSAYAERVKEFCKEGNHQIISQVTGASWGMEAQEVKQLYEKYAEIDRQNHQKAHPDYKFAPNKNGPASRKRKGRDDEDDNTDWEDRDYEGSDSRSKRTRNGQSVESRSHSSTPFEGISRPIYGHQNASSFHASNPRSVPPLAYPVDFDNHYYEQWSTPYGNNNIEDIHVRRVPHPGTMSYPAMDDQSLVGLPLTSNTSHPQQNIDYGMPQQIHMNAVDPHLEQYALHDAYAQYEAGEVAHPLDSAYDYGQEDFFTSRPYAYPVEEAVHPGMATLTSPRGGWDQPVPGSDFDDELGKWPV